MNNEFNKKIFEIINKVKRRMIISTTIKFILNSLTIGVLVCIFLAIVSHIVPVTFIYKKIIYIIIVSTLIGICFSMFRIPNNINVAKVIDKQGLQERTITALELMESDNPYSKIEIEDTYNHIRKINHKKIVAYKPPNKNLLFSAVIISLLFIIMAIPSKHFDLVKQKEDMIILKKQEKNKIKKVEKEIKDDIFLSKEDKNNLQKEISKLNKEIAKVNNEKEFKKQSKFNEQLIEFKKNKVKQEAFEKIAKKMIKNNNLKELGELLDNKQFDKANELIDKLIKEASKMSEKDFDKMMSNISSQLAGLDTSQLAGLLSQLINDMEMTNAELSKSQYASFKNSKNNNYSRGEKSSDSLNQNNSQSASNEGNSSGNNKGAGEGKGNGEGNSTNGNGSNTSGNSNSALGNGRGRGSYNSKTNEDLLDPNIQDKNINGQRGNKGESTTQIMKEGISIDGKKIPYHRVIGDYESKAYESMNSTNIPKGIQEVVKKYFSGLN
jgi:hypothetical protein